MTQLRIGILGDYNPSNPTHVATSLGLTHAAHALNLEADPVWLATDQTHDFAEFHALFASPGSPYRSLEGALLGIRYAREHDVPFLGTCGGFQHAILEYAHNVLGIRDAAHEESDPYASVLFVTRLVCSLVGKTMSVQIEPNSLAAESYGVGSAEEQYYCNFGLNPAYRKILQDGGLRFSGQDQDGEVRILEVPGNRYFVATLFVPQARSTRDHPHPLLVRYCRAAAGSSTV